MKLSFVKANPTDNMTVFILDPIPRHLHSQVSKKILDYGNLYGEQVGFVEPPSIPDSEATLRLQMMGGEFCGNATRALAAIMVERRYPGIQQVGGRWQVMLEVSGAEVLVPCDVEEREPGCYWVSAQMPLPNEISKMECVYEDHVVSGMLVQYHGISHAVFFTDKTQVDSRFVSSVFETLPSKACDALGIMLYNEETGFLTPVVYVPSTDTIIYERGCGSGSAALAAVLAHLKGESLDVAIPQPGGVLNVSTRWADGGVRDSLLMGPIRVVAEGQLMI